MKKHDEKNQQPVTLRDLQALYAHIEISSAPWGEQTEIKQAWADKIGVSAEHLDRLRKPFILEPRKRRVDTGVRLKPELENSVRKLRAYKEIVYRQKGCWISTPRAIRECETLGRIPAGLRPDSARRIARQIGLSLSAPEAAK